MLHYTWLLLVTVLLIKQAGGHGRMIEPPQRSSMWRFGFNTPPNYNDNELFCGGRQMIQKLGGLCGVCGDPYHGKRENEAGGKYATGVIARSYPAGSPTITIRISLTAYHKGHYEFRLCPHNNPSQPVTQECLNRYPLPVAEAQDQGEPTHYKPESGGLQELTLLLPPGMTCSQCVLQWRYRTGNSWGTDADSKHCLGCGVQEEFRNCADISIGDSSSGTIAEKPVEHVPRDPILPSVDEKAQPALPDSIDPFGNEKSATHQENDWLESVTVDPTVKPLDPTATTIPVPSMNHGIPVSPELDSVVAAPLPVDSKLLTSIKQTPERENRQPIENSRQNDIDFRHVSGSSDTLDDIRRHDDTQHVNTNRRIPPFPDVPRPNDDIIQPTRISQRWNHHRDGSQSWNRQGSSTWGRRRPSDLNRNRKRVFHIRTPSQVPRRNEHFIEPTRQRIFNRHPADEMFQRADERRIGSLHRPREPLSLDSVLRPREPQGERTFYRGTWEQSPNAEIMSNDIFDNRQPNDAFHDARMSGHNEISGSAVDAQRIRDLWWKIVLLNRLKRNRDLLIRRNMHTLDNNDNVKAPFALAHKKAAPKVVHLLPPDEQHGNNIDKNINSIAKKSDKTAHTKNSESWTKVKTYKNPHNKVSLSSLEGSNTSTAWYDKILKPTKKQ